MTRRRTDLQPLQMGDPSDTDTRTTVTAVFIEIKTQFGILAENWEPN